MRLELRKLDFRNFKGGTEVIDFTNFTDIYGANEAGKTRIFDAWLWLLFGKDSQGKSDFDIKPLDSNNNVRHKIDVEVSAEIEIDGNFSSFMKVYKEKWTKKKGNPEPLLTGHTTDYYINSMNITKKEYEDYIFSIIDLELFKLLSNPDYFESLNWAEKRKIIFSLVPSVSDEDIAGDDKNYLDMLVELKGRDMQAYKSHLATSRRKVNEDLKLIPSSISELEKIKPEVLDFVDLKDQLYQREVDLKRIDSSIIDESKALKSISDKRIEIQNQINTLNESKSALYNKLKSEFNKEPDRLESDYLNNVSELTSIQNKLKSKTSIIEVTKSDIEVQKGKLEKLRADFEEISMNEFSMKDSDCVCPTCKQNLPESDIESKKEDLKVNFNRNKEYEFLAINTKGKALKQVLLDNENDLVLKEKEKYDLEVQELKLKKLIKKYEEKKAEIPRGAVSFDFVISKDPEYNKIINDMDALEKLIPNAPQTSSELVEKKEEIENKIKTINSQLENETQIEKIDVRIKELNKKTTDLAQQIADFEQKEYTIEQFTKKKIQSVEEAVNAQFDYVKFKLYNKLMNGGEEECCITLIGGVPYSSANNAAKTNSGLDVIKTLSDYNNTFIPIIIDNRESVSEIIEMNNQVINLIVEKGQKKLRIENL